MQTKILEADRVENAIRFLEYRGYTVKRPTAVLPELLRIEEVEELTRLKKSTIYKLMKEVSFPLPLKIGGRGVAWRREELMRWIEKLSAQRG